MKKLAPVLFLIMLLAGCGTAKTYKPNLAAQPPKPAGYPIPVYDPDVRIPRPCELIGQLAIGDSGFTVSGGSLNGVMKTLTDTAHEKGADVIQVTSMEKPGFTSANYGIEANLLRYADQWETVSLSEKEFIAYLRQHQSALDPIEGVWSDGSTELTGIIRDNSRKGRDFIAFTLRPRLPSWRPGYKKMDIAPAARPGAYNIKFYREDFAEADTSVLLDHNSSFKFIIRAGDGAYPVAYVKLNLPAAAN